MSGKLTPTKGVLSVNKRNSKNYRWLDKNTLRYIAYISTMCVALFGVVLGFESQAFWVFLGIAVSALFGSFLPANQK
jgi:hypothetical protein